MGKPKRKAVIFERTYEAPKLGERLRLLEIAKEAGKRMSLLDLSAILEEAKKILFPLVEMFSKPISAESHFINNPLPANFQNRRGVLLFDSGFMSIWLERTGKWLVRIRVPLSVEGRIIREFNSQQLASLVFERRDDFLKDSLKGREFIEEIPCFQRIAFYHAMFVHLLTEFFNSVKELIRKREEKLRVMRAWLELLGDFGKSLDPLVSQGKKAELPNNEIWETTDHGVHNYVSSYFCSSALQPFWQVIKKRERNISVYKEHSGKYSFESLFGILERMLWTVEDIRKARTDGRISAEKQIGYNSGRLPFTEGEMAILKDFADSIAASEE
jgi:hypothetical protein